MADILTAREVERIARESGLTMNEVCRRAGVARSVFDRWKHRGSSPTINHYQAMLIAARGETAPVSKPAARDEAA